MSQLNWPMYQSWGFCSIKSYSSLLGFDTQQSNRWIPTASMELACSPTTLISSYIYIYSMMVIFPDLWGTLIMWTIEQVWKISFCPKYWRYYWVWKSNLPHCISILKMDVPILILTHHQIRIQLVIVVSTKLN
jgi:hypothetical protein